MEKRTFKTNIFGGRNREIIQLTGIGVMVGMLTGFCPLLLIYLLLKHRNTWLLLERGT